MGRRSKYPAETRERAVRLVFEQPAQHESQWAAISSIATKMGYTAVSDGISVDTDSDRERRPTKPLPREIWL